ncbi:MAG: SDR family oxidoreductase [Sphingobium sp.]|jgi:NAD(P)-dependent dehydrogenase (short-subunit alcohol dehydrogenase family)|nr:SDR family oxidoreductase [Sphingobium sp.]MCI1270247.1 SDR family oxidoreductase [Sphingobium sp.]MCI1757299.1 SDR family oxidoreductase [Sphingobium sp.]MCI2053299.1 SDR family oxidoreductase [Sphingobium sp.]
MSSDKMGRLAGKVAIITGGSSGVGRATCRRFAQEGAFVIVADINLDGAKMVAQELAGQGMAVHLDVASEEAWLYALNLAVDHGGKLDIVCNIAGVGKVGTIEELDLNDWQRMIAVNLTGTMLGCKLGLATILQSGGRGAIVNMNSIAGLAGMADIAGYGASKGGVTMLTKAMALHCCQKGYPVRCVSIHPTYIDTGMLDHNLMNTAGGYEERLQELGALIPIGRIATPEDVANAVLFAASDEAAMISGSSILVDGAQLAGLYNPG